MIDISYQLVKMTRQTRETGLLTLLELPNNGGHISVDVVDPQGEIGHVCVFRGDGDTFYCRKGTPDPRDLHDHLGKDLKIEKLVLAERDTRNEQRVIQFPLDEVNEMDVAEIDVGDKWRYARCFVRAKRTPRGVRFTLTVMTNS
jgi:hypothetical protein